MKDQIINELKQLIELKNLKHLDNDFLYLLLRIRNTCNKSKAELIERIDSNNGSLDCGSFNLIKSPYTFTSVDYEKIRQAMKEMPMKSVNAFTIKRILK